jgi:hypothetical protein
MVVRLYCGQFKDFTQGLTHMLGLFASKPNHPLADLAATKRIAAELARQEPRAAVDSATVWLESIYSAEGFKLPALVERLMIIEDAAIPQLRRLGREWVQGDTNSAAALATWELAQSFWMQLGQCHEKCVERHCSGGRDNDLPKDMTPLIYGAALYARAATQKWNQFRYRHPPDIFWTSVGALYLAANAQGLSKRPIELHAGHGETTIEAEYLKVLLFQVAAMDTLTPLEVELGERLIAHFLPWFSLTREVRPDNVYWVDAVRPRPPARLAKVPEVSETLYFFSGAKALVAVEELIARIETTAAVPPNVNLGGQYPVAEVGKVLAHLAECWAPKPPTRAHVRRSVVAPLALTHGFKSALQTIAYAVASSRTRVADLEVWSVSDISLGGMAIHGTVGRNDWARIGTLVAVLPDGGTNWLVGIIRRVSRGKAQSAEESVAGSDGTPIPRDAHIAYLGVETISKAARSVVADADGFPVDAIVLDLPVVGEYARLAVPPDALEANIALCFSLFEKSARLHPREVIETGTDYVIANFFVQSFS